MIIVVGMRSNFALSVLETVRYCISYAIGSEQVGRWVKGQDLKSFDTLVRCGGVPGPIYTRLISPGTVVLLTGTSLVA